LGALQAAKTIYVYSQVCSGCNNPVMTIDSCTFDAAPLAGTSEAYSGTNHINIVNAPSGVVISRSKFINAGAAGDGKFVLVRVVSGRLCMLVCTTVFLCGADTCRRLLMTAQVVASQLASPGGMARTGHHARCSAHRWLMTAPGQHHRVVPPLCVQAAANMVWP
jgi:hypothetical protein